MGFRADVFNAFIASPGDVAIERKAVREIIHEWNIRHADELKKVLLPVGWETHSTPDMSGHPQALLNKQLLVKCDLLIGIFWTRIGTPTEDYASGAVEEIERHIAASKPVMLYFSEKPVRLGSVDRKQYDELMSFQESCKSRGLYKSFKSLSDFRKQFENNLAIKMQNEYFKSIVSSAQAVCSNSIDIQLTKDEQRLLKAASQDRNGLIHQVKMSAGTHIQTNHIQIITEQNAREVARWKSALQSLLDKNMVKAVGFKGEAFEVTAEGFAAADLIQNTEPFE